MSDKCEQMSTGMAGFVLGIAGLVLFGWIFAALEKNRYGEKQSIGWFFYLILWLIIFAAALSITAIVDNNFNKDRPKETPEQNYFDTTKYIGLGITGLLAIVWIVRRVRKPQQSSPQQSERR
jgi:thiol:disulfide interchange protein